MGLLFVFLQHYQKEVENHKSVKERLDQIASQLEQEARGNCQDLQESRSTLHSNWCDLCALLEDREVELLGAQSDLLLARCLEDVERLEEWFECARNTVDKPVLVLSSESLGDAKEQMRKYKVEAFC